MYEKTVINIHYNCKLPSWMLMECAPTAGAVSSCIPHRVCDGVTCRCLGRCLQQNVTFTRFSTQSVSSWHRRGKQELATNNINDGRRPCSGGVNITFVRVRYAFINMSCETPHSLWLTSVGFQRTASKGHAVPIPADKGSNFVCVW